MLDLLPELRGDEFRDILSEIDAGELDEQYLVKHASDYGKQSASHPLSTLKTIVNAYWTQCANLLDRTRSTRPSKPPRIL